MNQQLWSCDLYQQLLPSRLPTLHTVNSAVCYWLRSIISERERRADGWAPANHLQQLQIINNFIVWSGDNSRERQQNVSINPNQRLKLFLMQKKTEQEQKLWFPFYIQALKHSISSLHKTNNHTTAAKQSLYRTKPIVYVIYSCYLLSH